MNPTEPLARFSARVQHATNGCWIWQGASVKGRGQIYVNGKNMLATRFAYQQFKGEIPEGMYVCHTCDDPSCVNPNHLWLGTARDNWQDARRKRRALQGIKREVCPQGHEYSGRECLTCRDARNKKRDHRAYRLAAQARRDAEVIALRARVAELEAANTGLATESQRLKAGLRFYARGLHFSPGDESDWEDVSGEPPNFLCDEHGNTIEDGTIAKDVLLGRDAAWSGEDWPPDELPEEIGLSGNKRDSRE